MRCVKSGVAVFKASMLNWLGGPSAIGICIIYIYMEICHEMCQVWCSGIQGIYSQLTGEDPCSIALGICALSIYISVMRCAKSGVAVFKASILDWLGVGVHLPWLYMHCLYIERSAMRCAKFGVVVFKASIPDWLGRTYARLHWVYVHCLIIYRSVMRCAKFGVAVFKASMLDWLGGSSVIGICIVYI